MWIDKENNYYRVKKTEINYTNDSTTPANL